MTRRLVSLSLLAALAACDGARAGHGGGDVLLKGKRFSVLPLASEKERKRVLPTLAAAEEGQGTLLCWPRERYMKLEPKNARASFDAVFMDRGGKVVDLAFLEAGDPRGVVPAAEAAYVLLVAPGTSKSLNIAKGDVAQLSPEIAGLKAQELATITIGDATAYVELALTESERQRGLMYRPRMSADDGMLFAYASEGNRSFWMGNTLIPLDLAFIREDGTLVNVNETPIYPNPEHPPSPYPTSDSRGPARFVLEMNLGWFKRKGLTDAEGKPKPGLKATIPPEALRGSE